MAYKLLKEIRIIDLTMVYAGPVATKIMVELGAEVIKIESGQRADVFTRANVYPENEPGTDPWNRGCLFHSLNVGKKAISLNLSTEKGRTVFKDLVRQSNAVIENFSPRVMENWGLNYQNLCEINPSIVMVSISGLGHYGPLKDYYMYVPGMEGMSGLTHSTGFPDEPPLLSGCAYGDWVTGANAAMALITALYSQKTTGKGQYVDLSGREANLCQLGDIFMDYALNKRDRKRIGNGHPQHAPHGCYRCIGEDNWITLAVEDDDQWGRFCQLLGNPEWSESEKYASMRGRLENQAKLDSLIEEWTSKHDKLELVKALQEAHIPAGAVLNMKEINLDPQLKERGFFQLIDHGEGIGTRPLPRQMPVRYSGVDAFVPKRAPHFDEDTDYILGSLAGLSMDDIRQLEEEKVVSRLPTFPAGRATRLDLIEKQQAGTFDPDYLCKLGKHFGIEIGQSSGKPSDKTVKRG